jgi:hypothetical protein
MCRHNDVGHRPEVPIGGSPPALLPSPCCYVGRTDDSRKMASGELTTRAGELSELRLPVTTPPVITYAAVGGTTHNTGEDGRHVRDSRLP